MNFLITGAQFSNKGAQSLLFTTICEIRKKYPDARIFYVPIDGNAQGCFDSASDYSFTFVYDNESYLDGTSKFGYVGYLNRKRILKKRAKSIVAISSDVLLLSDIWKEADVLMDISGYILSSKFANKANNRYLRYIRQAALNGMAILLMPQSFGPFEYDNKEKMISRISEELDKATIIFARENQGKDVLQREVGVKKVNLSPDLVLQSGEIDLSLIYKNPHTTKYRHLSTTNNVGIVPNTQTIKFGNEQTILKMYAEIINQLLSDGKEVYIFRHSNDLDVCKKIYNKIGENVHCHLIADEMNCLEYSAFITQFDYIIASRYHALVHAYKQYIPAIILGWSIKYSELAKLLDQKQFVFDITENQEIERILSAVRNMDYHYSEEISKIKNNLSAIQKNSVFEECWNTLGQ